MMMLLSTVVWAEEIVVVDSTSRPGVLDLTGGVAYFIALNDPALDLDAFVLRGERGDQVLGAYIKSFELGKLVGEVATHNGGPLVRQKKHVSRIEWNGTRYECVAEVEEIEICVAPPAA